MYEEQNKMIPNDFEPYLFSLESVSKLESTTMIVDTDYNNWAVIYNCAKILGFFVFDDYMVLTKNSVIYDVYSSAIDSALTSLVLAFPDIDPDSLSGPHAIQDNCP